MELDGFYALLTAVCGHKLLDGIALGVPFFLAEVNLRICALAFFFCSAMTPMGIGIGMAITDQYSGSSAMLAKAIIISLSAGSFLFIALVEFLPTGFQTGSNSSLVLTLKLVALIVGWGVMALIAIWV
eukprot:TRINITY_DN6548_c0_g1_i2.p2 TRINITY_DN6548_c0_g1~~TRINITY_DN6548_c0_g1_i2.p2  ORF type:complete len:128 (-),score=34.01 TRINITY_DN6548_c0_g1_i2:255-638(-)